MHDLLNATIYVVQWHPWPNYDCIQAVDNANENPLSLYRYFNWVRYLPLIDTNFSIFLLIHIYWVVIENWFIQGNRFLIKIDSLLILVATVKSSPVYSSSTSIFIKKNPSRRFSQMTSPNKTYFFIIYLLEKWKYIEQHSAIIENKLNISIFGRSDSCSHILSLKALTDRQVDHYILIQHLQLSQVIEVTLCLNVSYIHIIIPTTM